MATALIETKAWTDRVSTIGRITPAVGRAPGAVPFWLRSSAGKGVLL